VPAGACNGPAVYPAASICFYPGSPGDFEDGQNGARIVRLRKITSAARSVSRYHRLRIRETQSAPRLGSCGHS